MTSPTGPGNVTAGRLVALACLCAASLAFVATSAAGADQLVPAAAESGSGLSGNGAVRVVPPASPSVAVVAWSAPVDGHVAIVVANGTGSAVRVRSVVGSATASSGARTVRAATLTVVPSVLQPFEQALGSVQFRSKSIHFDDTFRFDVKTGRVRSRDPVGLATGSFVLSPPGTGAVAQTLDLVVTNDTSSTVRGRIDLRVVCLDEAGTPSTAASGKVAHAAVAPGATTPASVGFTSLCPVYVVAAQGRPAR